MASMTIPQAIERTAENVIGGTSVTATFIASQLAPQKTHRTPKSRRLSDLMCGLPLARWSTRTRRNQSALARHRIEAGLQEGTHVRIAMRVTGASEAGLAERASKSEAAPSSPRAAEELRDRKVVESGPEPGLLGDRTPEAAA
jgi:hypothetical protein